MNTLISIIKSDEEINHSNGEINNNEKEND